MYLGSEVDVTPKSFTNDSKGLKNLNILQAKMYASFLRTVFAWGINTAIF